MEIKEFLSLMSTKRGFRNEIQSLLREHYQHLRYLTHITALHVTHRRCHKL